MFVLGLQGRGKLYHDTCLSCGCRDVESYIMIHVCRPPAGHVELSCGLTVPGVKPRPLYDHVCTHLCGFVASLPAHCFPVLVRW